MAQKTYYEILTEAIADILEHGFDSAERIAHWQRLLKEAAERTMSSQADLDQMLRDAMAAVFKRSVVDGGVLKMHPGVSRFTLDRLKPRLHAELTRRVMNSSNLIRLNREQSIAKTLQRFSGWASSVPEGGAEEESRTELKKDIRKSLSQLPFEERRVLIDQSQKLASSINTIIAVDGGAIAVKWRSHFRQPGYDFREDHKERDGKIYLLKDSWAKQKGLIKPGEAGYYEDVTAFAQEPFCRCFGVWVYNLRDLPDDMLTIKGRESLAEARRKIAEMG